MSDDNGDAAFEADPSSIDGRLDTIHRTLSTLGMRIDALVTSTTTYRSALTDRLTEYADQVSTLSRTQAADLERLGARIDSLLTGGETSEESRQVLTEIRSAVDGQQSLSRTITEALDLLGGRVTDQLSRVERQVESSGQVVDESRGELAGLRAKVDTILETSARETGSVSTLIDEVREALLDVASGEVLGAMWDEFRSVRQTLDTMAEQAAAAEASAAAPADDPADGMLGEIAADVSSLRTELSAGLVVEPSEALAGTVDQLRDDLADLDGRMQVINQLRDDVADLRAVTERAAEQAAVEPVAPPAPPAVGAEEMTELRSEVGVGFGTLNAGLDRINEQLVTVTDQTRPDRTLLEIAGEVTALRTELAAGLESLQEERSGATADDGGPDPADIEGELQVLRTGVEDIIGRLDEGLVLADELAPPAPASGSPELADQFAVLRDQLTTEFDAMRQLVSGLDVSPQPVVPPAPDIDLSEVTELLEHVRDDLAALPSRIEVPEPAPATAATVDPDAIDLLREEIRAAGATSDELVDALRNDLVSLRRRIKLRAEGEIFTEDQLELIAEAVARRLSS